MSFIPRKEAPSTGDARYYADNPFYQSGYGMPNCTCYAYGRFWELNGYKPSLSLGNAEDWYAHIDGYDRGQTPKLGAIICWAKGQPGDSSDGPGHVAVVEEIYEDGSFLTSNSYWGGSLFALETIPASCYRNGNNFLGFIYSPNDFSSDGEWVTGNRYLTAEEQRHNAILVYHYLLSAGWTVNAIAAILGNMEVESTINPTLFESLYTDPEEYYRDHGRYPGYGLCQWTPYTKIADFASDWRTNHVRQLERLLWEMENGEQYYPTADYPETFREFSQSTKSAYYLAGAFLCNYERPANPNPDDRGKRAEVWYSYLSGYIRPPSGKPQKMLPLWLLFYLTKRKG